MLLTYHITVHFDYILYISFLWEASLQVDLLYYFLNVQCSIDISEMLELSKVYWKIPHISVADAEFDAYEIHGKKC